MHRRRPLLIVLVLACAAPLVSAPPALAHAQLLGTSPQSGSTVSTQPAAVIFKFGEAVGGTLGAVRVYNAGGEEVDDSSVSHPDGRESWMGVGLKAHLPAGTYTATYRVISADTHIVFGGLVFNIGHAGPASGVTVAGLIGHEQSGSITKLGFGVIRGLDYLSIALLLGALAFLLCAWLPALAALAETEPDWRRASQAFAARLRMLLAAAVALGLSASVLGILLQGASAAGVSLWASLRSSIVGDTLASRFGEVWGVRAIDWLLLGGLLVLARARAREPRAGAWPRRTGGAELAQHPRVLRCAIALGAAYLAIAPALAGHASVEHPVEVFFPADVLHVLAASVWVGGVACLLLVLPAATRQLAGPSRARLLLATLARFSPLALGAVIAIAVTGVVQAYIDVRTFDGLLHTTYGALIIVKVVLLLALIGLGAINRRRVIPALMRIAAAGLAPGGAGMLARRTLRGELALMLGVLGVTAALIGYTPPIDAASGPFAIDTTLGPAELELTLAPARVGPNTIHLYLIDAKTGAQFTATKELTVTAGLASKGIGPLPLRASLAGPGHYMLSSAELSPGGTWAIQITDRVSEFEQYSRTVKVAIR
jgi:copper transport protein